MITPTTTSLLAIIVPVCASLFLFARLKKNHIVSSRSFFWNYAFGFGIISISGIPVYLINLGVEVSYATLLLMYTLSFVAAFVAYLLFYRGTISLFTEERFVALAFPNIILPVISIFALGALFYLKLPTILIYTAAAWGFLFPNNMYISSLFLYSFAQGSPRGMLKRKFCTFVLAVGWFLMLGLDIVLWVSAVLYLRPDLWILKVASMQGWFIVRAIDYLIILWGVLLCARCLRQNKSLEEK